LLAGLVGQATDVINPRQVVSAAVDNPVGVLDSMGVAHLLDLPGSEPGMRRPPMTGED
jgi:hypothetical protein